MLYCFDDESLWLIPENIIGKQSKISIGYNKSKYNIYKVEKENIIERLNELYNTTTHFSFDHLNKPNNIYQQREQDFRKYREEKKPYIKFDNTEMEGTVYDFKIGNFKIQEKISSVDKENRCHFCIYKNNGGNNKYKKYNIGDNDFYWLNCEDKKTFFVIPEKILLDKGIISDKFGSCKTQFKVKIQNPLHRKSAWLSSYMFDYDNIDKERLLYILSD